MKDRMIRFEFSNGSKMAVYTLIASLLLTVGGWVWTLSRTTATLDRLESTVGVNRRSLVELDNEVGVLRSLTEGIAQDVTRLENIHYGVENVGDTGGYRPSSGSPLRVPTQQGGLKEERRVAIPGKGVGTRSGEPGRGESRSTGGS